MNKKYDEFVKRHPNLKLGGFGIECGEGWYTIIETCTKEILDVCSLAGVKLPTVVQIKEKFASLRYYVHGVDPRISDQVMAIINKAEEQSRKTCEICGKPGKVRKTTWVQTLCDEHTPAK